MPKFRSPRMAGCGLGAVALLALVVILSPQQGPVALYKLSLVLAAGYAGYWLDRWAFPYARPDGYLAVANWRNAVQGQAGEADIPVAPYHVIPFAAAMLRRAVIMGSCMLAVGLGL
ncbi:MAG: putative holin [Desulfovibrionaceae bacterium]